MVLASPGRTKGKNVDPRVNVIERDEHGCYTFCPRGGGSPLRRIRTTPLGDASLPKHELPEALVRGEQQGGFVSRGRPGIRKD